MLCDDGSIKRIKFSDTLREQNDDIDKADFAQRFDADFVLMTGELSALIERVIEVLGGEAGNFITRYHSTKTAYLTL